MEYWRKTLLQLDYYPLLITYSPCNWEEALFTAAQKLRQTQPNAIAGIAGALVDTGKAYFIFNKSHIFRIIGCIQRPFEQDEQR